MRSRRWLLACLAALTLAGASLAAVNDTPAAAQSARPAASTECGSKCMTISSAAFGTGWAMVSSGAQAGADLYLLGAGNSTNEDFIMSYQGTVEMFYDAGIFNSTVGTTWPDDDVYEYEYSPGGTPSNLCVGETAIDAPLTLQACSSGPDTYWIALANDKVNGAEPLVTAIDNQVNAPYVMTVTSTYSQFATDQMGLYHGTYWPDQMMFYQDGAL
jgi:hypothetical protein